MKNLTPGALDHQIVAGSAILSFAERGLFKHSKIRVANERLILHIPLVLEQVLVSTKINYGGFTNVCTI
jgi:hypothetical protein